MNRAYACTRAHTHTHTQCDKTGRWECFYIKKRVTGGLRKFVIRSIIILYSLNIIIIIIMQSMIMCWPGDMAYMGVGNVCRMFIKKLEGKRWPLWVPRHRCEDSGEMILKKWSGRVCTGIIWLRMVTSDWLLRCELTCYVKDQLTKYSIRFLWENWRSFSHCFVGWNFLLLIHLHVDLLLPTCILHFYFINLWLQWSTELCMSSWLNSAWGRLW